MMYCIGRCCRIFTLSVLEYCSAVWCLAANTHLTLLDRVVSGARFLTWSVFECDISHLRSVAVLCMLYKLRYNPMHPLYGVLRSTCALGASAGYTLLFGRTTLDLCAFSLQNLVVPHDFYFPLIVTVERAYCPYSMVWD